MQPAQEPVELVQGAEAKGDAARTNLGRATGKVAHLLLEARDVGISAMHAQAHRRADAFGLRGGAIGAGEGLGLGGGEASVDDFAGAGNLGLDVRHGDEAARVAGPQRAGTDEALHLVGQGEETEACER